MPFPLAAPRVNNNDDVVRIVGLKVAVGDYLRKGELAFQVETDKAVVEVPAEKDGYVLKLLYAEGDKVTVGAPVMWQGAARDEAVPEAEAAPSRASGPIRSSAKARTLLAEFGIDPRVVPTDGDRLSRADVEAYIAAQGIERQTRGPTAPAKYAPPVSGELLDLTFEERGMLATVAWQRDQAAAAYLEVEYDPQGWNAFASAYATEHRLMLPPLLPVMAWRLVQLARQNPRINATIVDGKRYQYAPVNLGFTVQAGEALYLVVLRDADTLEEAAFVSRLGDLQRRALGHKLSQDETGGATIAFSSMARWQVTRHVPLLPPYCSLIVAHAAPKDRDRSVLGATYDHRLLTGFDAVRLLTDLAKPPLREFSTVSPGDAHDPRP